MISLKTPIHTTLDRTTYDWLSKTAEERKIPINELLETAIKFYRENKELPEENRVLKISLRKIMSDELSHIFKEKFG